MSTGNYIRIWNYGDDFMVAECYLKDGKKWRRGTKYLKDGTELKFDWKL